jgi:hypothetical protein
MTGKWTHLSCGKITVLLFLQKIKAKKSHKDFLPREAEKPSPGTGLKG